jgi:ectoine hydroxylase-related dioxygenase (phytanoyl-CoA dioxygenase family)
MDWILLPSVFNKRLLKELLFECNRCSRQQSHIKSLHLHSQLVREIASTPEIVSQVKAILGDNILLWGSSIVSRPSGTSHRFHIDVEHAEVKGATVWIGLSGLNANTLLKVISHTDDVLTSPQELSQKYQPYPTDTELLLEARNYNPDCNLSILRPNPGDCVIWKGRVWHGTENNSNSIRTALILQYCTAENIPRLPKTYEYPNIIWHDTKPQCFIPQ